MYSGLVLSPQLRLCDRSCRVESLMISEGAAEDVVVVVVLARKVRLAVGVMVLDLGRMQRCLRRALMMGGRLLFCVRLVLGLLPCHTPLLLPLVHFPPCLVPPCLRLSSVALPFAVWCLC